MEIKWKNRSKNYLKRDIDSETLVSRCQKCKREVFGRNKYSRLSREWKMYDHLEYWVDVFRRLIKRVASSEKKYRNRKLERVYICGYGKLNFIIKI